MTDRLEYLNRGITGRMSPLMRQVKTEWEQRMKTEAFPRLDSIRYALSCWTIVKKKNWWFMLLPYGKSTLTIKKNIIQIRTPLFSIYWYNTKLNKGNS